MSVIITCILYTITYIYSTVYHSSSSTNFHTLTHTTDFWHAIDVKFYSSTKVNPEMTLLSRRTLLNVMAGMLIGLIISPIMWLQLYFPPPLTQSSINPLCPELPRIQIRNTVLETATSNIRNVTELSRLELDRTVNAPSDTQTRQRHLSQELAQRKLLLTGVVTAQKYLDTRALGIWKTWGKELNDLYFFSSQPDKEGLDFLPIITLPGVNDTKYPPQRKVYRMLKYMHDHFIDDFDFFMRSDDDVYVKTDLLLELLQNTNPAQDIYMGCPGFGRPDDLERIKLKGNEHYCMGGPGVIFSRSALRKLAPYLENCLEVRKDMSC